jgi:serine/threonine protein kinase HipA of HipAB toxin-antitoxin module
MNNRRPEPSLDDLLNDPILHALLARDGLKVEEVRRFLDEMRQRLRLARREAA